MDQLMDIYVNHEGPAGYPGKRMSLVNSSESIYENVLMHSLERKGSGPALPGAEDVKKRSCRAATVFLALLCLLLLIGLITSVCLSSKSNSQWKAEMALLKTSYKNVTEDRNQLQTSYNNLSKERDSLLKGIEDISRRINDLHRTCQEPIDQIRRACNRYYYGSLRRPDLQIYQELIRVCEDTFFSQTQGDSPYFHSTSNRGAPLET